MLEVLVNKIPISTNKPGIVICSWNLSHLGSTSRRMEV
jgi:hypothetical protein